MKRRGNMSDLLLTSLRIRGRGVDAFDVLSLIKHLKRILEKSEFQNICEFLSLDPEKYDQMVSYLKRGVIKREFHSVSPRHRWNNSDVLRVYFWVCRFRGDLWRIVAEGLTLANYIGANSRELHKATLKYARYSSMTAEDWKVLLESGAHANGKTGGWWHVSLFEKHVKGNPNRVA